jgi:hypothetical protein
MRTDDGAVSAEGGRQRHADHGSAPGAAGPRGAAGAKGPSDAGAERPSAAPGVGPPGGRGAEAPHATNAADPPGAGTRSTGGEGTGRRFADPRTARLAYLEEAAEAGRLLLAAERARLRLDEARADLTAAYASWDAEEAHLDRLEERATGIWRELTTRFGPDIAGPLPGPAAGPQPARDAEALLSDAHRHVREPVDHLLTGRYVRMGVLGFVIAAGAAVLGLVVAGLLRDAGRISLIAVYGPILASPWIGHLAAVAWIRLRTSHEEKEYAVDTAIAGTFGGGGVWLIALIFVVVRLVT